ncbi:MAG: sigma-70 family RNA polymerase sigma factor, partial [Clostridia bacterium]|nr:sigma-70 family RNA polymerase sigma factor [Clostridia bacterium]
FDLFGEDHQERDLTRITLHQALDQLVDKERAIIVLRYFLDQTQSEVAERLGISQVSVSRLEKNILKKLSKMIS